MILLRTGKYWNDGRVKATALGEEGGRRAKTSRTAGRAVDQQLDESIRRTSRFDQRRLNEPDDQPAWSRRQLWRRGRIRRRTRQHRFVRVIECAVRIAAERQMADRMRVRVLMNDDFAMSVFFDRVRVLGRHNRPKSQGGHESRQQGATRRHARTVSHAVMNEKRGNILIPGAPCQI